MKVHHKIENVFLPMNAEDFVPLQELRKQRDRYWAMLRKAKDDYLKLTDNAVLEHEMGEGAFYYYLQQHYGLKVELIDGKIGADHAITDEQKYLLFILKYGGR